MSFSDLSTGYISQHCKKILDFIEVGICITFCILDTLWILHCFVFQLLHKLGCNIFHFCQQFLTKLSPLHKVYENLIINSWCAKKNYICLHNRIYCLLTNDKNYASDQVSMKKCFDLELRIKGSNRVSFFTKDPESVYVDNCANTHISNNKDHFVDFNLIRKGSRDKVSTVGGFGIY